MGTTDDLTTALTRRNRAVIDRDVPWFKATLTPGYHHIHTTGKVDDLAAYIASVEKGDRVFPICETTNYAIQVLGTAGVITGDIFMQREGTEGKNSRFVSVWTNDGGRWLLAHWQVTARQDI